jgi:cyclase
MRKKMFAGASNLLFERATKLRERQTAAEEILWNYLKTKPLGFKFRRQHPFLTYILDFYCHSLQLVIEVDGSIHELESVKQKDQLREGQLIQMGLTVLRFSNDEIKFRSYDVFKAIENHIQKARLK